jgi:hypothetical protein
VNRPRFRFRAPRYGALRRSRPPRNETFMFSLAMTLRAPDWPRSTRFRLFSAATHSTLT